MALPTTKSAIMPCWRAKEPAASGSIAALARWNSVTHAINTSKRRSVSTWRTGRIGPRMAGGMAAR